MSKSTQEERACVNALVKALRKNSPDAYIHIDRDMAGLRPNSPWDFLVSRGGYVAFIEAKMGTGLLSDVQKLAQAECKRAGSLYIVLRFSDKGKTFICSNLKGAHRVETMKAEKFFGRG